MLIDTVASRCLSSGAFSISHMVSSQRSNRKRFGVQRPLPCDGHRCQDEGAKRPLRQPIGPLSRRERAAEILSCEPSKPRTGGLVVARELSRAGETDTVTPNTAIEQRVHQVLDGLEVPYEVIPIGASFADTAAFCEHYGFPLDHAVNTIIVGSKKEPRQYCACLVLATMRLDVNHTVRKLMGV